VREALRLLPQVLFFDIRMPGLDGLGAAAELADCWPADEAPMPQLVFVTAYDEYAARAFEAQAIDYVLKPVQPERLRKTVGRLQQALAVRAALDRRPSVPTRRWSARSRNGARCSAPRVQAQGRPALGGPAAHDCRQRCRRQHRAHGAHRRGAVFRGGRQVPARADRHARIPDPHAAQAVAAPARRHTFWQVHRAVVVRSAAIESVHRDEAGKMHLTLRGRAEKIPVSRLYAHLFRAM
jgi:DNA-binding LytR/AlgR family response regulator